MVLKIGEDPDVTSKIRFFSSFFKKGTNLFEISLPGCLSHLSFHFTYLFSPIGGIEIGPVADCQLNMRVHFGLWALGITNGSVSNDLFLFFFQIKKIVIYFKERKKEIVLQLEA